MKRVLSVDGGGIKALRAIQVLIWLENQTRKPLRESFDEIIGTSAGGIIAMGLGAGLPATQLCDFFTQKGPGIFSRSAWQWLKTNGGLSGSKYNSDALQKALAETFGSRNIPLNTTVMTFDTKNWMPRRLTCLDAWTCVEAGLATSAAPTYFPPFVKSGIAYWDGGLIANNPAMVAKQDGPTLILSVGDGSARHGMDADKVRRLAPLELVSPVLSACMDGGMALVDVEALARPEVSYTRVQGGPFQNDGLDDTSAGNMATLLSQGTATIAQHEQDLERVVSLLTS